METNDILIGHRIALSHALDRDNKFPVLPERDYLKVVLSTVDRYQATADAYEVATFYLFDARRRDIWS